MHLSSCRGLLEEGDVELDLSLPHALTEARKEGLTASDWETAVMYGEGGAMRGIARRSVAQTG